MHARLAVGLLSLILLTATAFAADWPQWRGPHRDGHSPETGLLKQWPEDGPKVAWQVENVGVGYSSVAVGNGRIYTMGDLNGVEHILCLNTKDGSLLWAVQPEPVAQELDQRVAEEFERTDADGDGQIDELEALRRLGFNRLRDADRAVEGDAPKIADQRVAALLQALDKDKDGQLTYAETDNLFRDVYQNIDRKDEAADAAQLAQQRTAALFQSLDTDGDAKLSRDETRGSVLDRQFGRIDQRDEQTKQQDKILTRDEVLTYLEKFEAGKDGLLTRDELQQYYSQSLRGQDGRLSKDELRSLYGGYRNGQGDGPRCTPTLDGELVYCEGGNGDLTCLNAQTGKTVWYVNLVKDLGGGRPGWGYSESPLVYDQHVIVTPGGKQGTLAALNKYTGEVVWRSTGVTESAHYSSPIYCELAGKPQIVQFARNSVFGVPLDGSKQLWSYSGANNGTANVCTPIAAGPFVFTSSAYGTGGGLVQVTDQGDVQQAEEIYFEKKMANHHGGIVKVGETMYGFGSGGLLAMDFKTGKIHWAARSVGKGSLLFADGMLYCLGERYEVALVEATPEEYREHGRFKIDNLGRPSWAHPAVADGRFYIRNQQRLTAYQVAP